MQVLCIPTQGRKTKGGKLSFISKGGKKLSEIIQRCGDCPIPGNKVKLNGGFEQPDLLKGVPLTPEGWSRWPLKVLYNPNHSVILWFFFMNFSEDKPQRKGKRVNVSNHPSTQNSRMLHCTQYSVKRGKITAVPRAENAIQGVLKQAA